MKQSLSPTRAAIRAAVARFLSQSETVNGCEPVSIWHDGDESPTLYVSRIEAYHFEGAAHFEAFEMSGELFNGSHSVPIRDGAHPPAEIDSAARILGTLLRID